VKLCCSLFAITNRMSNRILFFVEGQGSHGRVRGSAGGHSPKRLRTTAVVVGDLPHQRAVASVAVVDNEEEVGCPLLPSNVVREQ